jgi:hypothetical protein
MDPVTQTAEVCASAALAGFTILILSCIYWALNRIFRDIARMQREIDMLE